MSQNGKQRRSDRAGPIRQAIARRCVAAGIPVLLSNSRRPGSLVDVVAELGDEARVGTDPATTTVG
jgi:predicted dinucleotide-binding enzyme